MRPWIGYWFILLLGMRVFKFTVLWCRVFYHIAVWVVCLLGGISPPRPAGTPPWRGMYYTKHKFPSEGGGVPKGRGGRTVSYWTPNNSTFLNHNRSCIEGMTLCIENIRFCTLCMSLCIERTSLCTVRMSLCTVCMSSCTVRTSLCAVCTKPCKVGTRLYALYMTPCRVCNYIKTLFLKGIKCFNIPYTP